MKRLYQALSTLHPLSEPFKLALEKAVVPLQFPKHHLLQTPPRVSDQAFFLDEGFAMSYVFSGDRRQVENFWMAGQTVVSFKSFFEQVPAREFIELMEPGRVLCINYANVMTLLDQFAEANVLYRLIANQHQEHCRERLHDLQYLTAEERFKKLHRSIPRIEQSIAQEDIASYLGIAPQSLSRIKRRRDI